MRWLFVFMVLVALLMRPAKIEAGQPTGYFIVTKVTVTYKEVPIKGKTGLPLYKQGSDEPLKEWVVAGKDEKLYLVVVKTFLGVDRLWKDAVYEVPEGAACTWQQGRKSGEVISLPIGWEGWRKVKGDEHRRIRDAAKGGSPPESRYFGNPKRPTAVIRVIP